MKSLHHLGPSPEHAQYQALWRDYLTRTNAQEKALVKAGLPAKGLYDFGVRWRDAWNTQDVDLLRECMAPDCSFIDASTYQNIRVGREETLANCASCFEAFPDMAFYPQDDTLRSLPYADYTEGQWRVAIPWRGVARWTGPVRVPGTDIVFPPSGKCLNFIGVDRYTVTEDWRISHIDTDWDMAFMMMQLAPVALPAPSLRGMKVMSTTFRALMPALRFLGRNDSPEGARRFDLPLPSIQSADDWADGAAKAEQAVVDFRSRTSA